jgi:hypothetical protein
LVKIREHEFLADGIAPGGLAPSFQARQRLLAGFAG